MPVAVPARARRVMDCPLGEPEAAEKHRGEAEKGGAPVERRPAEGAYQGGSALGFERSGTAKRGNEQRAKSSGRPYLLVRFLWARKENEPVVRARKPAAYGSYGAEIRATPER